MSARIASMVLALTCALAGCAVTPATPPGNVVTTAKIEQVQPGITTKAELLARLGPTTSIRFENGVEVWRYLLSAAAPNGPFGEYVVVIDASGIVAKARRADVVYQIPTQK
jgi:outer membrane protein assembly factor BamE (lipoprotein component of BamABCDE complex)